MANFIMIKNNKGVKCCVNLDQVTVMKEFEKGTRIYFGESLGLVTELKIDEINNLN